MEGRNKLKVMSVLVECDLWRMRRREPLLAVTDIFDRIWSDDAADDGGVEVDVDDDASFPSADAAAADANRRGKIWATEPRPRRPPSANAFVVVAIVARAAAPVAPAKFGRRTLRRCWKPAT